MTVALSFEPKHSRRVLATRALGTAKALAGTADGLRARCREVVVTCGPAPYLYAQKHHPPAMEIMGAIERALWPGTKNVPASVPDLDEAAFDAALFRTFRPEIPAERFVAAWAERGAEHALAAFVRLDDFPVTLVWSTRPMNHIAVEAQLGADEPLPLARELRAVFVAADAATYARVVERARRMAPRVSPWIRAGLAVALPDEAAFTAPVAEELLGMAPAAVSEARARAHWLRWLLAGPLDPALARRVLGAIGDDLACPLRRGDSPVFTWIALEHAAGRLDALAALLVERAREHLGGRGWATARSISDGLAALRSEEIVSLFAEHVGHKAFAASAPEVLERHADLALGRLLAIGAVKGKHQARARELAQVLAQKRPELATGPAVAGTGAAVRRERPVAAPAELPAVLAAPPWAKRHARPKATRAEVTPLPHEERVDFDHGEREALLEQAKAQRWLIDRPDEEIYPAGTYPSIIAYNLSQEVSRQNLLAARGVRAIDYLLMHVEHRGGDHGVEPMSRIDSPRIALPMARLVREASGPSRLDAQVALVRHPRAAAVGLVPPAAAGDAIAREGLRFLVLAGAGEVVRDVIATSDAAAAGALRDVVALTPLGVVPARLPALPKFFVASGFPPPVIVASGKALGPEAVATLGTMLRFSETLFPYPGIAEVRAACTPASLDAFAWALERAWEHAKAPEAQRFAAVAVGHLGSERLLARLAEQVSAWEKKKAKLAEMLLEAFAASPLAAGAVLLGRFAVSARESGVRATAERWLRAMGAVRGTSREELALSFSTLGLDRGEAPIEDGVVAVLDEDLDLSLRRGKAKVAPKVLGLDGAAAWEELRDALADTKAAIVRWLDLALSHQERFGPAVFERLVLRHPLVSRLATRLVLGVFDASGALVQAFRRSRDGRLLDARGESVSISGAAAFGLLHPIELDVHRPGERAAFAAALAAVGEQPVEQLQRATFPAPATWPLVRGTVVPYRKIGNRCMKPIPARPASVRHLAHEAAAWCGGAEARGAGLAVERFDCGAVRGAAGILGCELAALGEGGARARWGEGALAAVCEAGGRGRAAEWRARGGGGRGADSGRAWV